MKKAVRLLCILYLLVSGANIYLLLSPSSNKAVVYYWNVPAFALMLIFFAIYVWVTAPKVWDKD